MQSGIPGTDTPYGIPTLLALAWNFFYFFCVKLDNKWGRREGGRGGNEVDIKGGFLRAKVLIQLKQSSDVLKSLNKQHCLQKYKCVKTDKRNAVWSFLQGLVTELSKYQGGIHLQWSDSTSLRAEQFSQGSFSHASTHFYYTNRQTK